MNGNKEESRKRWRLSQHFLLPLPPIYNQKFKYYEQNSKRSLSGDPKTNRDCATMSESILLNSRVGVIIVTVAPLSTAM